MATIVEMPKLGFNMDEGTLVKWYKQEGDPVAKGEPLFTIETDKTAIDVEATEDGVVGKLLVSEGSVVAVFTPIGVITAPGEDVAESVQKALADSGAASAQPSVPAGPAPAAVAAPAPVPTAPAEPPKASLLGKDLKITPRARRLAEQKRVDFDLLASWAGQADAVIHTAEVERFLTETRFLAGTNGRGQPRVSPRAKKLAQDRGIPLEAMAAIPGSGYDGAICAADVERFAATYDPTRATGVKVSPLAARIALDQGIDLAGVQGNGANGKIMKRDLPQQTGQAESSAPAQPQKEAPSALSPNDGQVAKVFPYKGVRKVIGERLAQSWQEAPHIFFTVAINMRELLELRKKVNSVPGHKISVTDFLVKAVSLTLREVPVVNSSLRGNEIYQFQSVNIGVAVAAPTGLIVPVIRNVQELSLAQISETSSAYIEKARQGKLLPSDYTGGTFTISNMGMFGVDQFTAIINPPEAGILAVGATIDKPVVVTGPNGEKSIEICPMMNVTLSADHRVVDGEFAGIFVKTLREKIEHPLQLLL